MSVVRVSAVVRVDCESGIAVARAEAALAPENLGHLCSHADGSVLVLDVPEGEVGRTLATVDDALACLTAAFAVAELGRRDVS